jgi:hypothetical protein
MSFHRDCKYENWLDLGFFREDLANHACDGPVANVGSASGRGSERVNIQKLVKTKIAVNSIASEKASRKWMDANRPVTH